MELLAVSTYMDYYNYVKREREMCVCHGRGQQLTSNLVNEGWGYWKLLSRVGLDQLLNPLLPLEHPLGLMDDLLTHNIKILFSNW